MKKVIFGIMIICIIIGSIFVFKKDSKKDVVFIKEDNKELVDYNNDINLKIKELNDFGIEFDKMLLDSSNNYDQDIFSKEFMFGKNKILELFDVSKIKYDDLIIQAKNLNLSISVKNINEVEGIIKQEILRIEEEKVALEKQKEKERIEAEIANAQKPSNNVVSSSSQAASSSNTTPSSSYVAPQKPTTPSNVQQEVCWVTHNGSTSCSGGNW